MLNKFIKTISLYAIVILACCFTVAANAAPQGIYLLAGGGLNYQMDSSLGSTTIATHQVGASNYDATIAYHQTGSLGYTARTAVGYFFPHSSNAVQAYGLELGFNYFGPKKSNVNNVIHTPIINTDYAEHTQERSNAWSMDLEGVFSQDLIIPHTAFILKAGVGYESMVHHINNFVPELVGLNILPATETLNPHSFGIVAGMGLQFNIDSDFALRTEIDAFKGFHGLGYVQGVVGGIVSFA